MNEKEKGVLIKVHGYLGELIRDNLVEDTPKASDLADDVWDILHKENVFSNMTFGQAIDACRYKGKKIQRKNWNGAGQFVRYEEVLASEDGKMHYEESEAVGSVESRCFVFHFVNRHTGETGIQVGWLASQADMYADDWVIVD